MGYGSSLGGAVDGGCGYGWPELGPAVGGGAPGVLGKWVCSVLGSRSSQDLKGPVSPLGRVGTRLRLLPGLCLLGCPLSPRYPPVAVTPTLGLPLGPSPFSVSNLPALGPLPTGPENLIPGKVRPPCGGESTVLVPALLLPLWEPGPQNVTWQGLSLPVCGMGIPGPVCFIPFTGLL